MNTVVVYINEHNEVYVRHNASASSLTVEATKHNAETSDHFVYKNAVLSAYIKSANVRIIETIEVADFNEAEIIKLRKIEDYASQDNIKIVNQRDTALTSSFYRELIAIDNLNSKSKYAAIRIDERAATKHFAEIRAKYDIDSLVKKFSKEVVLNARKHLTMNEFDLRFFVG